MHERDPSDRSPLLHVVAVPALVVPDRHGFDRRRPPGIMGIGTGKRIQLPRSGERVSRCDIHLHIGDAQHGSALAESFRAADPGLARRARTLWLRGGCSREQLFQLSERFSWRALGAVCGPLLSVVIVGWIFVPHPGSNWIYGLVAILAPGICSLYLGLMNVSGWHPVDVIAAILIVILGCGVPIVDLAHPSGDVTAMMILLLIVQFLGALVLRWVARERWQRIDWLICKPHRLSSQALRPVI